MVIYELDHFKHLSNIPSKPLQYRIYPIIQKWKAFILNIFLDDMIKSLGNTICFKNLNNCVCHKFLSSITISKTPFSTLFDSIVDWVIWITLIEIILWLGLMGINDPIETIALANWLVDCGAASRSYFLRDDSKLFTNFLYFCNNGSLHWKIPLTWFTINNKSPINLIFFHFNFMANFMAKIKASYLALLFM